MRALRAKDPLQFVFYYKDTKDTDYLKNVTESMDAKYIQEIKSLSNLKL